MHKHKLHYYSKVTGNIVLKCILSLGRDADVVALAPRYYISAPVLCTYTRVATKRCTCIVK